jgi:hypothetical protein
MALGARAWKDLDQHVVRHWNRCEKMAGHLPPSASSLAFRGGGGSLWCLPYPGAAACRCCRAAMACLPGNGGHAAQLLAAHAQL